MPDTTGTPTSSGRWSTDRSAADRSGLRLVEPPDLAQLLGAFCGRYPNPNTNDHYSRLLRDLFRTSGHTCPAELTESELITWCTGAGKHLANNSIRSRISVARTFLAWCVCNDHASTNPMDVAAGLDGPLRQYRRTYGKVEARNPPRWLTKDEAFGTLLGACAEQGLTGLRDELIIRLGLLGLRASEIGTLRVGDIHTDDNERSHLFWMGKGRKPRRATAGPAFTTSLQRWLTFYSAGLGHSPSADHPLLCPMVFTRWAHRADVRWGKPFSNPHNAIWQCVTARAQSAGLGHVAPHDLRRTAAGILHRSTDATGKHDFDLLDIQKVLGHSDPATTMRCYLDPMDSEVIDRAANSLD